ncbi:MAG: histone deacetylase family protein [Brevirhabdus sp.]
MATTLITDDSALEHVTPPGHPEQVARLRRILDVLDQPEFAALDHLRAPMAADDDLLRAHPKGYVDAIRGAAPETGLAQIDGDTFMSPGSLEAAYRAVGGGVRAVDTVIEGQANNAFVAMRPPGHHAEETTAMGFCLFSNVAIAAKHALEHHGLSRVAIVDFDVHHGNGTQNVLEDEPRALFCSTHQMPLFPGTGHAHETGAHDNVVNVPLAAGDGRAAFEAAMEGTILPRVQAFQPELILISAGFDAHAADPLANLNLIEADFAWVTARLCDIADAHCGGRVVSTLEGGYDLDALAASVAAHVRVLMERGA